MVVVVRRFSAPRDLPYSVVPEMDPAREPCVVRRNPDVLWKIRGDMRGIPATEIKYVVMQQVIDDTDGAQDATIPFLRRKREAGLGADIVVIGVVFADRMLRKLQVRCEPPLAEYCAADARTEREHDLEASPSNDPQPLYLRIVEQARGLAEAPRRRRFERIVPPRIGVEVRGRDHAATAYHAGKANGDPIEGYERCDQTLE